MARDRLFYHLRWPVKNGAPPLSDGALERLGPYLTRYAQTLGAHVHAVGGAADHLHILAKAPPERALLDLSEELRRATGRFLRDVLNLSGFAWDDGAQSLATVSPDALPALIAYVNEQPARHAVWNLNPEWEDQASGEPQNQEEELPDWLRDVVRRRE